MQRFIEKVAPDVVRKDAFKQAYSRYRNIPVEDFPKHGISVRKCRCGFAGCKGLRIERNVATGNYKTNKSEFAPKNGGSL